MRKKLVKVLALTLVFVLSLSSNVFASNIRAVPNFNTSDATVTAPMDLNSLPYVIGDGFIEFEVPINATSENISPFATHVVAGSIPTLSAHFARGQTSSMSNTVRLDSRIDAIPPTAQITNVTVSYNIATGHWANTFVTRHDIMLTHFSPNHPSGFNTLMSPSNQLAAHQFMSTNAFNRIDPWGLWDINLVSRRDILMPSADVGATATIRSFNLRVYWR